MHAQLNYHTTWQIIHIIWRINTSSCAITKKTVEKQYRKKRKKREKERNTDRQKHIIRLFFFFFFFFVRFSNQHVFRFLQVDGSAAATLVLDVPNGPGFPRVNGMGPPGTWWFADFAHVQVPNESRPGAACHLALFWHPLMLCACMNRLLIWHRKQFPSQGHLWMPRPV